MAVEVVRVSQNPFDFLVKALGMTRAEFGRKYGFGKPYLLKLSQGRHAGVGVRASDALLVEAAERGIVLSEALQERYGTINLDEAWGQWISEHRAAQTIPDPARKGANPFARLVNAAGGVARMSALLAAPDPLVERYAKGRTPTMPRPIREALEEMKYPYLQHLDEAMREAVK